MMNIKPVILYSDFLVFILIFVCFFALFFMRKRHDIRMAWQDLKRKPLFGILILTLGFYFIAGFLDCLHFQEVIGQGPDLKPIYSPVTLSVLDKLFGSLATSAEVTYSAPFALFSYVKDSLEPRLLYPPATVEAGFLYRQDLMFLFFKGLFLGWMVFLSISFLISFFAKRYYAHSFKLFFLKVFYRKTPFHWFNFFLGLLFFSILLMLLVSFASHYHILGTDKIGNDVFYMTVKSIRTGLLIGTLTTMIILPLAISLGLLSGYFGGKIDDVIQFIYTVLSSVPGVLLIAASILSLQILIAQHSALFPNLADRADLRLLFLCAILGLSSWASLCRLIRGETLKLRELDYVLAAKSLGVGHMQILKKHILPNLSTLILITTVMDFSALVLAEAVLSYVGVGVDPTAFSWGNMINSARLELARDPVVWWPLFSAFLFMFFLVLSANLLSDSLRDSFDPKTQRETLK